MSIEARIHRWIRPDIIDLEPYHVPDARGMTKLDAMENPYSWPKELRDLWLQRLAETPLNRYPDAAANELRTSLLPGVIWIALARFCSATDLTN